MIMQMKGKRENGQLGAFSSFRELFAGPCPRKNGCRTIGVFPPWNARLPLGLREQKWEQKDTEQVSAAAAVDAISWPPSTGLRQDLLL